MEHTKKKPSLFMRLLKSFARIIFGDNPFATTKAIAATTPKVLFGMLLGLIIYNPTVYSLTGLVQNMIFNQAGYIEGMGYWQPSYGLLVFILIALLLLIKFKWQIARDELGFVLGFYGLAIVANYILISLIAMATGNNPLSIAWVQWQILPIIMGGLAMGATLPKVRRAGYGAVTLGGGATSVDNFDPSAGDAHVDHDDNR